MGSNNPENSTPCSISSEDDYAGLMAFLTNLSLKDRENIILNQNFQVGSSSLSMNSSDEQSNKKEEIIFDGQQTNGSLNKRPLNSFLPSNRAQWQSPVSQENIWAYDRTTHAGSYQSGLRNLTCKMKEDSNYLGYEPVTSPKTPLPSYLNQRCPSTYAQTQTSNCPTNLSSQHFQLFDDQSYYSNYGSEDIKWNGYNNYHTNSHSDLRYSFVFECCPEGLDFGTWAKTHAGSYILYNYLVAGDSKTRNWILLGIFDSIPELMNDINGHHVFQKLIKSCNNNEFEMIARKLTSEPRFLLDAAFITTGSYSIQIFIKRLKKSPMAFTVTSILSTRFFEIMTHPIARHVIKQCLSVLGFEPNMVLYEAAVNSCYTLAVHNVGCISINDCIDFITGELRDTLLQRLSDQAAYLANDPFGNFVVQHILKTQNPMIVNLICHNLRGQYISLSEEKGKSHVIEKCVTYSTYGMTLAVDELLENSNALFLLAKHRYGNYVVQTMLKVTKLKNIKLYDDLVKAIEPHISSLKCYQTGRNVLTLIGENPNKL